MANLKLKRFIFFFAVIITAQVNNASAQLNIFWKDSTGVTVNNGTADSLGNILTFSAVRKTAGNGWSNAGAVSENILPSGESGWVEYTASQPEKQYSFGLSTQNSGGNPQTIKYAFNFLSTDKFNISENGVSKTMYANFSAGDKFRIERSGNAIQYKRYKATTGNWVTIKTSTAPTSDQLMVDLAVYSSDFIFKDARASFEKKLKADAGADISRCREDNLHIPIRVPTEKLGGRPPLSYSWSPSAGLSSTSSPNPTASVSETTEYTLTVTDHAGQVSTDKIRIIIKEPPVVERPTINACIGLVDVKLRGADTYSWSPAAGLNTTSGDAVVATVTEETTNYNVTATGSNGCAVLIPVVIHLYPKPVLTLSPNVSTCLGTPVTLSASLAVTTSCNVLNQSTFSWSPAAGLSSTTGNSVTANPTVTTTYTVVGTDICGKGCTATKTVVVTVKPLPVIAVSPSTSTICAGGTATLTAGGGSTYSWSPSDGLNSTAGTSVSASPEVTTTYTVTGTAANGCTNTATAIVIVAPPLNFTVSPSPATICYGSSVGLTASPTLLTVALPAFSWSPSTGLNTTTGASVTASPLTSTTYTVTLTGGNGCTNTVTTTVSVNPAPDFSIWPDGAAVCAGSSVDLSALRHISGLEGPPPPYDYSWAPATGLNATTGYNVTATPASTTTYTVTATDVNGCTSTHTATITVNPLPSVSVYSQDMISFCPGNSTVLTANGASTYSWAPSTGLNSTTGGNVTASPVTTTTYTVVGTDANGCTNSAPVTINVGVPPTVTVTAAPAIICPGESTVLTASGANSYTWQPAESLDIGNGASATAQPLVTTTYTVTGGSVNGCSSTAVVTVTVNPTPVVSVSSSSAIICSGSSTTLTASGASTYSWSPATGLSPTTDFYWPHAESLDINGASVNASPLVTTTYTVTGSSVNGCSSTAVITVTVNPTPVVSVSSSSAIVCRGSNTTLTASGASTYSWSPATGLSSTTDAVVEANPGETTFYSVFATDENGCLGFGTVTVEVYTPPTITLEASTYVVCDPGSKVDLSASGAVSYVWQSPSDLFSATGAFVTVVPVATTTYTVTGTDANGCTNTATITITVGNYTTFDVTPVATTISPGGSVSITATGGDTYSWSPATGLNTTSGATVIASPAETTTYTVTISNACGSETATSVVTVNTGDASCVTVAMVSGEVCRLAPVTITGAGSKGCAAYVTCNFGDGYSETQLADYSNSPGIPAVISHLYSSTGVYTVTVTVSDGVNTLSTQTSTITVITCEEDCHDCIPSFSPIPNHKYILSAWVKQAGAPAALTSYTTPQISILTEAGLLLSFHPSGEIIDGWQKVDGEFTLPGVTTDISIKLECASGDCYFDDIRVFPFDGSMKSYVYDPVTKRLVAELDERNYATLYEYDEEGKLVRVKKETERGIMTIKENRNNTSK